MPKSWQEIEFLDYKERQVRRRSQKTRELQQVAEGPAAPDRRRLLRMSLGGVAFLAMLVGGIFAYQRMGLAGNVSSTSRSVIRLAGVSGQVEVSTASTNPEAIKSGATIISGSTVHTGKNGKVVLLPSLPGAKIILYENSMLSFEKIQLSPEDPESAALFLSLERGEAMIDFPKGKPVMRLELPLVVLWSRLVRCKVRLGKDVNRILVTRFAAQAEDRADSSRKEIIAADQELVATLKSPVGKAKKAGGAALRERWD